MNSMPPHLHKAQQTAPQGQEQKLRNPAWENKLVDSVCEVQRVSMSSSARFLSSAVQIVRTIRRRDRGLASHL